MAIAVTAIFIIGADILLLWFLAVISLLAIKYSKFKVIWYLFLFSKILFYFH